MRGAAEGEPSAYQECLKQVGGCRQALDGEAQPKASRTDTKELEEVEDDRCTATSSSATLPLDPGRTALLVVDMQRAFVDPGQAMEVPPGARRDAAASRS